MKNDFEIGPPPQRRSKIVSGAPAISEKSTTTISDVTQPESEVVQLPKTTPTQPQVQAGKRSANGQPEGTAPQKNAKSKRVIQTRAEAATLRLPTLNSHSAVEAFTHIPKPLLKEMKNRLCPAFDPNGSGRVDVDALLKWMFGNMTWLFSNEAKGEVSRASMTARGRTELANAILKEIAVDEAQKRIIDRGEVIFCVGRAMAAMFSAMDRCFGNTLPPALKGLTETEIQIRLLAAAETFKQVVRAELEKFTTEEKVNNLNPQPTKEK